MPTKRNYFKILFYVASIATLILLYTRFSELKYLTDFFRASRLEYLVLVLVIQFFYYYGYAYNYRYVLLIKNIDVSAYEIFPVTFVINFVSQALPSANISGQFFFISYLKKYGLTLVEGVGRAILELLTLYAAYAVFFIITVISIYHYKGLTDDPKILLFIMAFMLFIVIVLAVMVLSQRRQLISPDSWLAKLPFLSKIWSSENFILLREQLRITLSFQELSKRKKYFFMACVWQVIILLTHVMTLYVISIGMGQKIPFTICFIAFTLSKFISMVSFVPGAPGVFEGVMTVILVSFGTASGPALAATLILRAFTFWLTIPIGWVLYGYYTKKFEQIEQKTQV